jgi:hypothetical protein
MAREDKSEKIIRYYRNIIQKIPSKGSKFTKNGGYIIPDKKYITLLLKIKFRSLQKSYDIRNSRNNPNKKVDPEDYQFVE